MKSFFRSLLMIIFACTITSSLALADDNPRGSMGMHRMKTKMEKFEKMDLEDKFYMKVMFLCMNAQELGLSEEQKEKIQSTKLKLKRQLATREANIEITAIDIRSMLDQDKIDTTAVNNLIDKKYQLKAEKAKDIVTAYSELKQILTAEQVDQAKNLMMEYMSSSMRMMMGGGKCPMMQKHKSAQTK
jgi:Spy/CpxP family protein refolding chaperone